MLQKKDSNRRQFLKSAMVAVTGVAGFPYLVPSSALGKDGNVAPSNRITIGCIGVGPQGTGGMRNFLRSDDAQVVAICDVKTTRIELVQKLVDEHYQNHGCATYNDFRELLVRDDIDAVLIATPDHWHVLHALAATKAGKDIYLEKPMGMSLAEDQTLRDAVHRYRTIFQFGTQQRSNQNFRFACELVRNGRIGKLHTVNVWSPASLQGGSAKPIPVPDYLDYDMWLGPAPFTPYTENKCSADSCKKTWWFNSDYALGFIAGWGIHPMDIALWGGGKELAGPVQIEGTGLFPAEGACDTAIDWNIVINYAGGVKINFTAVPNVPNSMSPQGQKVVEAWQQRYGRASYHGTAFEGTEGWVHVDRSGINTYPKSLLESVIGPDEVHLYHSTQHVRNFLDCVKSRVDTICPIDVAVRSDILCHLSEIAIRTERKLTWDPESEHFIDDDIANRMLKSSMRSPWQL